MNHEVCLIINLNFSILRMQIPYFEKATPSLQEWLLVYTFILIFQGSEIFHLLIKMNKQKIPNSTNIKICSLSICATKRLIQYSVFFFSLIAMIIYYRLLLLKEDHPSTFLLNNEEVVNVYCLLFWIMI